MIYPDFIIQKPSNQLAESNTNLILKNSDSLSYHLTISEYKPSPLFCLPKLARWLGVGEIYIKDESTRFGLNAFKGLGTSYAVHQLIKSSGNISVFCTATEGNHGRALAWSARMAGKKSVIVVPAHTKPASIELIKNEGAEIVNFQGNYDEACLYAERISKQEGWQLVQDVAWEGYEEIPAQIMAGYLSIFKEMEPEFHSPDRAKADVVFLQAGVGSFAGSAVWYYLNRYGRKKPKIVIIEPKEADGILESFKQDKLTASPGKQETIMAGLNCGLPSSIAWPIIRSGVDVSMRIEDESSRQAMAMLAMPIQDDQAIISGESGAAGFAGFLTMIRDEKFKPILKHLSINHKSKLLFINTEGNLEMPFN